MAVRRREILRMLRWPAACKPALIHVQLCLRCHVLLATHVDPGSVMVSPAGAAAAAAAPAVVMP